MNEKETFSYTYSAEQEAELTEIQNKYKPREESKMEMLRRLDRSAHKVGAAVSLTVGIFSTLLMGVGMCCCLECSAFVPGIILGVIGIGGIITAYPLYMFITKKQREKIAPEVLRLIEEIREGKEK